MFNINSITELCQSRSVFSSLKISLALVKEYSCILYKSLGLISLQTALLKNSIKILVFIGITSTFPLYIALFSNDVV